MERPPILAGATVIRPAAFEDRDLVGVVYPNILRRSVRIEWSFDGAADKRVITSERFNLEYWPTAVSRISDQRLTTGGSFLVAGKRPTDGLTLVERWDLSFQGAPGANLTTEVSRRLIYGGDELGRRTVRKMAPVNGSVGKAFVHFDDSNDLYTLSSEGELVLVLSAQAEPALGSDTYVDFAGGRNEAGHFVYVYRCDPRQHSDGALLFEDFEGDGTIEEWTYFAPEDWPKVEAIIGGLVANYGE